MSDRRAQPNADERRRAALTLLTPPYGSVTPTAAQARFLLDLGPEALYGGAAGGGKSVALLMAALQFVDIPGFRALLLRRTLTELQAPGGLLDVAHQWLNGHARWIPATSTFVFPNGSSLTFGHLDHEAEKLHYQGLEFQYIGFDELTHFTESQYKYLFSRLRRPSGATALASVPLRMRAATNPGGPGHDWVHRHFIEPWEQRGQTNPHHARCTFHPALLSDNPHLDAVTYHESLARLDPITRAQLADGNWNIRQTGRMFQAEWFEIVPASAIPERCDTVRFWDLAATAKTPNNDPDYTAGALVSYDHRTKTYYIHDIQHLRDQVGPVERHIRKVAEHDGRSTPVYIEQEPGSAGKIVIDHYRTDVLNGWSVRGERPTGDKIVRAEPFSARAEHGEVKLVRGPWNQKFLDEVVLFPDGPHDDQVDAVAGAMTVLARRPHYDIINIPVDELSRENPWRFI